MKNIIIFCIVLISCNTQSSEKRLKDNILVSNIFSPDEINQLEEIQIKIDSFILLKTKDINISNAYHTYCDNLTDVENMRDFSNLLKIDRHFYNDLVSGLLEQDFFEEIWLKEEIVDRNSEKISRISLGINQQGKYVEFLKNLSKENNILEDYYEILYSSGDIGPAIALGLLKNHNAYDFNDPVYRFLFDIHFITLHYLVILE